MCQWFWQDVGPVADLVLESQYQSLTVTYSVLTALCVEVYTNVHVCRSVHVMLW